MLTVFHLSVSHITSFYCCSVLSNKIMSSADEWRRKMCVYTIKFYSAMKGEQYYVIFRLTEGTGNRNFKWNKPGLEWQISRFLSYMESWIKYVCLLSIKHESGGGSFARRKPGRIVWERATGWWDQRAWCTCWKKN